MPSFFQDSRNSLWNWEATSTGAASLLLGADGDRRAVLVAAGDHEHVVAGGAVVASEDVGRQVGAGDLTDVEGAVGVGPGDGDEYLFGHMCSRGF